MIISAVLRHNATRFRRPGQGPVPLEKRLEAWLFVMGPHAKDMDYVAIREHFVNESMLNIDPACAAARQVADQLFVSWWRSKRILREHIEHPLSPLFQVRSCEFLRIHLGLSRIDQLPTVHQSSSGEAASTPSARA